MARNSTEDSPQILPSHILSLREMEADQNKLDATNAKVAKAKMEPEAQHFNSVDRAAAVSLAISMKRIADAICGAPGHFGLNDSIRDAIETAIFNATRR